MKLKASLFHTINKGNELKAYPNIWCVLEAFFIAAVFGKQHWYKVSLYSTWFSTLHLRLSKRKSGSLRYTKAVHLNRLISLLTRLGRDFHIPSRNIGLEDIDTTGAVVFCTVHIPLAKVGIRSLLENNITLDGAIVGKATTDNLMSVYGLAEKINALARNPHVLIKARSILANNGNIVLMLDNGQTTHYSPNIMHLCGKMGAKVVFFFSELTEKNSIINTYKHPPNPYCRNKAEIDENIEFLKQNVATVLGNYKK